MNAVIMLINFDPRLGWTACAPGCGAAGANAWDALAEALHRWDRAGRPAAAGIQYGQPPRTEAVGSVARDTREFFEIRAKHFEHPCADQNCLCQRTRRALVDRVRGALDRREGATPQ